jgi:hypothetical protein
MARTDSEAARAFWRGVYDHYPLTPEEVENELHDYWACLQEVPKVYDEITRGHLSKPTTRAQYIIDAVDERIEEAYREGLAAGRESVG